MSDPLYTKRVFGLKHVVGCTVVRDYASPFVDRMREEGFRLDVVEDDDVIMFEHHRYNPRALPEHLQKAAIRDLCGQQ